MVANVLPVFENWLRATVSDEVSKALEADRQKAKPERMLSRNEVCQMLGVSMPTLWSKTKSGEIECTRVGRRVLYTESAIKKFMEG